MARVMMAVGLQERGSYVVVAWCEYLDKIVSTLAFSPLAYSVVVTIDTPDARYVFIPTTSLTSLAFTLAMLAP